MTNDQPLPSYRRGRRAAALVVAEGVPEEAVVVVACNQKQRRSRVGTREGGSGLSYHQELHEERHGPTRPAYECNQTLLLPRVESRAVHETNEANMHYPQGQRFVGLTTARVAGAGLDGILLEVEQRRGCLTGHSLHIMSKNIRHQLVYVHTSK